MVSVEVDGDLLEWLEGVYDAPDADPGDVLEVAGYGQVGSGGLVGVTAR